VAQPRSSQSVSCYVTCVQIIVWLAECFPALNFVKICLPKSKWCPQSKEKVNGLSLNDKVKVLGLLKGSMSSVEVGESYGKHESSIQSTVLNSVHPEWGWSPRSHRPTGTKHVLSLILLALSYSFITISSFIAFQKGSL
jgi:hypothetical protein